jgi:hypothetical protein
MVHQEVGECFQLSHEIQARNTRSQQTTRLPAPSTSRKRLASEVVGDIIPLRTLFQDVNLPLPPRKSPRLGRSFDVQNTPYCEGTVTAIDKKISLEEEKEPQYGDAPPGLLRKLSTLSQLDDIAERFRLLPISIAVAIAEGNDISDQETSDILEDNESMSDFERRTEEQFEVSLDPEDTVTSQSRLMEEDEEVDGEKTDEDHSEAVGDYNRNAVVLIKDVDSVMDHLEMWPKQEKHECANHDKFDRSSHREPSSAVVPHEEHSVDITHTSRVTFRCGTQFDEQIVGRKEEEFSEEEVEIHSRLNLRQDTLWSTNTNFWVVDEPMEDGDQFGLLQDAAVDVEGPEVSKNEKLLEVGSPVETLRKTCNKTKSLSLKQSKKSSSDGPLENSSVAGPALDDGIKDVHLQHIDSEALSTQNPEWFHTQDYEDQDESWRPHTPQQSGKYIEVDDEIIDSLLPVSTQRRLSSSYHKSARQHSSRRPSLRPSLRLIRRKPSSNVDEETMRYKNRRKPSIDLGYEYECTRQPGRMEIPETQFEDMPDFLESRQLLVSDLPIASYFERASQNLSNPITCSSTARTESGPTYLAPPSLRADAGIFNTLSLSQRSSSYISTPRANWSVYNGARDERKILQRLTRQASQSHGTTSNTGRKRTMSLPFKPPFKNLHTESKSPRHQ